jgi:hypothetical protein
MTTHFNQLQAPTAAPSGTVHRADTPVAQYMAYPWHQYQLFVPTIFQPSPVSLGFPVGRPMQPAEIEAWGDQAATKRIPWLVNDEWVTGHAMRFIIGDETLGVIPVTVPDMVPAYAGIFSKLAAVPRITLAYAPGASTLAWVLMLTETQARKLVAWHRDTVQVIHTDEKTGLTARPNRPVATPVMLKSLKPLHTQMLPIQHAICVLHNPLLLSIEDENASVYRVAPFVAREVTNHTPQHRLEFMTMPVVLRRILQDAGFPEISSQHPGAAWKVLEELQRNRLLRDAVEAQMLRVSATATYGSRGSRDKSSTPQRLLPLHEHSNFLTEVPGLYTRSDAPSFMSVAVLHHVG